MNINFESTIDQGALSKSNLVKEFEGLLKNEFYDRNYGRDIENLSIKISIVNPPEGFEHLHKDLPPKYVDNKVVKNRYTGESVSLNNHFFFSISITDEMYEDFVSLPEVEGKRIIAEKILASLKFFDKLPKKVKNFNKDDFKRDMKMFFESQGLI